MGVFCGLPGWVHTLVYTLPQSLYWYMKYNVILDRVITAAGCVYQYIDISRSFLSEGLAESAQSSPEEVRYRKSPVISLYFYFMSMLLQRYDEAACHKSIFHITGPLWGNMINNGFPSQKSRKNVKVVEGGFPSQDASNKFEIFFVVSLNTVRKRQLGCLWLVRHCAHVTSL